MTVSVGDVGDVALGGAVMMMSVGDVDEVALGELFTKLSPTLVNALSSNRTGLNGSALGFRVLNLDFFEFTREHAGACSSPCTSNSPPPPLQAGGGQISLRTLWHKIREYTEHIPGDWNFLCIFSLIHKGHILARFPPFDHHQRGI